MKTPSLLFTDDDRARLARAVADAERGTAGEIVPYIVGHSDHYPEAPWRAGALLAALVMVALASIHLISTAWLPYGVVETVVATACAFVIGALAVLLVPRLRLLFVPGATVTQRVEERAAMAFLSEQVFATRDRSGILLFLSLLERRVRVMGDAGISAAVKQEEWDGLVSGIVQGMKSGRPAQALEVAIGQCGALLAAHGVAVKPDDTNELDNTVRLKAE
jgi:putative membrane protein